MSILIMISNGLFKELMSNIFFLKYFIINYVLDFMYRMFNEKFLLMRYI